MIRLSDAMQNITQNKKPGERTTTTAAAAATASESRRKMKKLKQIVLFILIQATGIFLFDHFRWHHHAANRTIFFVAIRSFRWDLAAYSAVAFSGKMYSFFCCDCCSDMFAAVIYGHFFVNWPMRIVNETQTHSIVCPMEFMTDRCGMRLWQIEQRPHGLWNELSRAPVSGACVWGDNDWLSWQRCLPFCTRIPK